MFRSNCMSINELGAWYTAHSLQMRFKIKVGYNIFIVK